MSKDHRLTDDRKQEPVDGSPEMGGMADVVQVAPGHVPAVEQIERREDVAGDRNGNQVDVNAHLRLEEDRCEKDGRYGTGRSEGVVADVILVLDQVAHGGDGNRAHIQDGEQHTPESWTENGREILLDHRTEEVQREHIENEMPPAAVHKPIGQHPIPLFPMPNLIGIEQQRIDIQDSREAQDAHQAGYGYDDDRDHTVSEMEMHGKLSK